MAQRLIRLICVHCAEPTVPDAALIEESRIPADEVGKYGFMLGKGCGHCRGSGYRGRRAISEILIMTDEIRELIVAQAPIRSIKEAARRGGTRYLRENALELVRNGITALQEANRVTFAD
jgi:general secretion pathway protein E